MGKRNPGALLHASTLMSTAKRTQECQLERFHPYLLANGSSVLCTSTFLSRPLSSLLIADAVAVLVAPAPIEWPFCLFLMYQKMCMLVT